METGIETAVALSAWYAPTWSQWSPTAVATATLIQGREGDGARHLVRHMARALLCSATLTRRPCGTCSACRQVERGAHPDLMEVAPPAGRETIPVESIRALNAWSRESAHYGGPKAVVIALAEQLNAAAANALLKTLEEPSPAVRFLLLTERIGQVLPTIRSRCQRMVLPTASAEQALDWLQERQTDVADEAVFEQALALHQDAPLKALAWLQADGWASWQQWREQMNRLRAQRTTVTAVAEQWMKWPKPQWALDYFYAWTVRQARRCPEPMVLTLQRDILRARGALAKNANVQLALEHVLLRYLALKKRKTRAK